MEDDVPDKNHNPRRAIVFDLVAPDERARSARQPAGVDRSRRSTLDATARRPPNKVGTNTRRAADLKVYVLRRADASCEGCQRPPPFVTTARHPYLEPHHTRRLSDGGPDDYHHVIALRPTCDRRVHHGLDGQLYNEELIDKLGTIEPR